jgi:cell division protein FtsB
VAELADALGSGLSSRKGVRVQVPPSALKTRRNAGFLILENTELFPSSDKIGHMKIGPIEINPQRIAIFLGIAILLFLIIDFNTRLEGLSRLQNGLATKQAYGTGVVVTQHALETRVAYATSDAAAQEYARNQAHLIQPGDIVVVPVPVSGATPQPSATPTPVFSNMTNWDVWMEFLFGK